MKLIFSYGKKMEPMNDDHSLSDSLDNIKFIFERFLKSVTEK